MRFLHFCVMSIVSFTLFGCGGGGVSDVDSSVDTITKTEEVNTSIAMETEEVNTSIVMELGKAYQISKGQKIEKTIDPSIVDIVVDVQTGNTIAILRFGAAVIK